jgi:hypothetical protein
MSPRPGLRVVLFDSSDVLMRPTSPSDTPVTEAWRGVLTENWPSVETAYQRLGCARCFTPS